MKVGEGGGLGSRPRAAAAPRRFADALRAAHRVRGAVAGKEPPLPGGAPLDARGGARAAGSRRRSAVDADDALRTRRDSSTEEARLAAPLPPPPAARAAEAVTAPELRALVRTLPVAIQTFGVRDGAPLALSFGRSLDVEVRSAPRGVEVVLRPDPRLLRAAEAELRGVVAALAAKGIAVSRAEVRVRGARGAGERAPRVDLAAGLR